jgi:hypothetical protein
MGKDEKLVRLNELFEQRKFGPTHGSFSARLPLRTPSGTQFAESLLEAELVRQLNFSNRVHDILTQPVLRYLKEGLPRRYTADVIVELHPSPPSPIWYLIEVKRQEDLDRHEDRYREKFQIAREWCADNNAEFRIMTEQHIRTDYLYNANLLSEYLISEPSDEIVGAVWNRLKQEPASVAELTLRLSTYGLDRPTARKAIFQLVANRFVHCDLSRRFDDQTVLSELTRDILADHDSDPIIKNIRRAPA